MTNSVVQYSLPVGTTALYPPVSVLSPNPPKRLFPLEPNVPFTSLADVIRHYTLSSLSCEGFQTIGSISVGGSDTNEDPFRITLGMDSSEYQGVWDFGQAHQRFLSAGFKALNGANRMQATSAWNPMSGFQVDGSDGLCQWALCLPLGMAMLRQRAVILMHYPPYIAMQNADYLYNNTLARWQNLLVSCGVPAAQAGWFTTIVDVNPIAAPGSGQSEYPNDYFPIMMSSLFFDDAPSGADYIRTMVGTLLGQGTPTLPLLVCGAPAYDPQAPGWFRVAYKDQLPTVPTTKYPTLPGIVQANVLQAGNVTLAPAAPTTPYMIANHMIAAGVEGRMVGVDWSFAGGLPDIRYYEAQDLSAAEFVRLLANDPTLDPAIAKQRACYRWFGNADPTKMPFPVPPADQDKQYLCANALVDTYFNLTTIQPYYTLATAMGLVSAALPRWGTAAYNPCRQDIYPPPPSSYKVGACEGCAEGP